MSDATGISHNIDEGLLDLTGDAETELWRVKWPGGWSDLFESREEAEAWSRQFPDDPGFVQVRTIHQQYSASEWKWA
jgi:hypothetical protein